MSLLIAYLLMLLMIFQFYIINKNKEECWEETLLGYKKQMRWTILLISFVLVLVLFVVLIIDYFLSKGNMGALDDISEFILKREGPHYVVVIAFFTGVLKLFLERLMDDSQTPLAFTKELIQSFISPNTYCAETVTGQYIDEDKKHSSKIWIYWFVFSLFMALTQSTLELYANKTYQKSTEENAPISVTEGSAPTPVKKTIQIANVPSKQSSKPSPRISTLLMGLLSILVLGIGYISWIYMIIFERMTGVHHFSARATRIFLGNIFNSDLPKQVIVIGPSGCGKTTFIKGQPEGLPTTGITIRNYPVGVEPNGTIRLCTIDPPGEHMGDHLVVTSMMRADTLVLMLQASWLDVQALSETNNYELDQWQNLLDNVNFPDEANYLRAFSLGTKRDKKFIDPKTHFRVRAFVLYFNTGGDQADQQKNEQLLQVLDINSTNRLASLIGERFGVPSDECCVMTGNSAYSGTGRDLMAYTSTQRKQSEYCLKRT